MASWKARAKKIAPYAYMILAQIIAASYAILSKIVFTQGTNTIVFNIYQFTAATIFMGPLAFFIERKARPPLSLSILCWMFLLALLGATLFQNLFSASLNYISSTTQSAILNLFPAFTYLLSIASRQETPELNRLRGIGKLSGTLLSVSGAFTMIFWHGKAIKTVVAGSSGNWVVGYILATLGILSLSSWLVLQGPMARRYPAELSMTTMMYFFGTLQTCLLVAFVKINASEWKLKWDLELLNIFFGGVVNSGIGIFIFSWCARVKGPLFVAVFAPLTLLFTALVEVLFLGSTLTVGRKTRPPLSLSILCWMFFIALLGATLFQNLFSASLNYVSSTTQSAILNLFPAFTYLLSIASRQEAPELNHLRGIGKLSGTLLSVSGAFTMIFWHGKAIKTVVAGSSGHWVIGYTMATLGILSLSSWLVLQGPMSRRYPAELSRTAMMYFFGTLQTCLLVAFVRINASEWKLKWDLELLNIFFGGVVNSGIGIFIFSWCARVRGPLFVAVFAPLTLLFTAMVEVLFLGGTFTTGSIVGSLMIVGGLYVFLWSKYKEESANFEDPNGEISSPRLLNGNP